VFIAYIILTSFAARIRRTDLRKEISIKPFDTSAIQKLQRVGKLTLSLFAAALFRQILILGRSTAAVAFARICRKIQKEEDNNGLCRLRWMHNIITDIYLRCPDIEIDKAKSSQH
jgi:hypothetical protein